MPLHLLLGLRTSETPSAALQRRRTSLGMSLKYRHCSCGFQMGPSVNRKPVQSFSTTASLSTSRSSSGDFTSTESPIQSTRLLIITRPRPTCFQYVPDHNEVLIEYPLRRCAIISRSIMLGRFFRSRCPAASYETSERAVKDAGRNRLHAGWFTETNRSCNSIPCANVSTFFLVPADSSSWESSTWASLPE